MKFFKILLYLFVSLSFVFFGSCLFFAPYSKTQQLVSHMGVSGKACIVVPSVSPSLLIIGYETNINSFPDMYGKIVEIDGQLFSENANIEPKNFQNTRWLLQFGLAGADILHNGNYFWLEAGKTYEVTWESNSVPNSSFWLLTQTTRFRIIYHSLANVFASENDLSIWGGCKERTLRGQSQE